jgi:hypothetical protein
MPLITTTGINSASRALGRASGPSFTLWYADRSKYNRPVALIGNVSQQTDTDTPAKYAKTYSASGPYGALELPLSAFPLGATQFYIDTVFSVNQTGDVIFMALGTPLATESYYSAGIAHNLLNYAVLQSLSDTSKFVLQLMFFWRNIEAPAEGIPGTTEITPGSWNHLAVLFNDGNVTTFLNGKIETFINDGNVPQTTISSSGYMTTNQSNTSNSFDPSWDNILNPGALARLDVCASWSTTQATGESFSYFRATANEVPAIFGLISPRSYTVPAKTDNTTALLTNGSLRVPGLGRWMDDSSQRKRNVAYGGDVHQAPSSNSAIFGLTLNSTSPGALIIDEFIDVKTNPITLDCWININDLSDQNIFCFKNNSNSTKLRVHIFGGKLRVDNGSVLAGNGVAINSGAWLHLRVTRDFVSGTFKTFIDGSQRDTGTFIMNDNTTNLWIGSNAVIGYNQTETDLPLSTAKFKGFLGNIRINLELVDGNDDFTKPTQQLTSTSKTELLLNFQSTSIPSYPMVYFRGSLESKADGSQPRIYSWLEQNTNLPNYFFEDEAGTITIASVLPLKGIVLNLVSIADEHTQPSVNPPSDAYHDAISVLDMAIPDNRMPSSIIGNISYRLNNNSVGSWEARWDNYVRIHDSTISCDINLPNANLLIERVTVN